MFRVGTPPIIRNTYNCNYSSCSCRSSCSTTAERSRDGLTNARCCDYSYMCSWWWVELPSETCRASSLQKYDKLYIVASCRSSYSTTAEGNRDGLTSARCCDYSYMCSWWWVELPPETCRASSLQKYDKLYIVESRRIIHNVVATFVCLYFSITWPQAGTQLYYMYSDEVKAHLFSFRLLCFHVRYEARIRGRCHVTSVWDVPSSRGL